MILKAGTYRFNDVLINFPDGIYRHEFRVDVGFVDGHYTSHNGITYGSIDGEVIMGYGIEDNHILAAYYNGTWNPANDDFYPDDHIQYTHLFYDTEVDDTFGTWYISNTNYNEVNAKPIAEITYNGQTIAQLNAGETAVIKCEEKRMVTDIIIKINS